MEALNQDIFRFLFESTRGNPFFAVAIVFFAKYLPYLLVAGFLVLILSKKDWRPRLFLAGEGALALIISRGIITEAIRFFYHHARPFEALSLAPLVSAMGNSFPSGHAALFFALGMVVAYENRLWGWWYFGLSALVVIARVFAGVHWPLDVLAGAIVGIATGAAVHKLIEPHLKSLKVEG